MQLQWRNSEQMPVIRILLLVNAIILSAEYIYTLSFEENGSIENAQVFVLFITMLCFLYATFTCHIRPFALLCTLTCFAFLLREVDVEDLNIPSLALALFSGKGKYASVLALLCPTLYWTFKKHSLNFLVRDIGYRFKKFSIFIALFFVLSWIFDKGVVQTNNNPMLEELCEFNAYILIFFISIFYINQFSLRKIQEAD